MCCFGTPGFHCEEIEVGVTSTTEPLLRSPAEPWSAIRQQIFPALNSEDPAIEPAILLETPAARQPRILRKMEIGQ